MPRNSKKREKMLTKGNAYRMGVVFCAAVVMWFVPDWAILFALLIGALGLWYVKDY